MHRTILPLSIALAALLGAITAQRASAQPVTEWTYAADAQGKLGIDLAVDAQNNAYVVGQYQGEIMLRKVDAAGALQWETSSAVGENLRSESPANVFVGPDGNVVVVGYRYYLWNEWGRELTMLVMLKYTPDGALLYKHLWPGALSCFDNQRYRYNVTARMDADGYVYIGTGGNLAGITGTGFNAIKVSPSGNIVHATTEPFTGDFFQVYDIRLLGDKLGLSGATSYFDGNSTAWVLDTAGTSQWTNVNDGEGGRDIVLHADGSAYVLTWRDPGFVGDVVVYKVNADGTVAWDHTYDQGRHESALAMEPTPDGNMVVMAKGNTTQSVYTDRLTIWVDTTGAQLAVQRYNQHGNNYETPYCMKVDAAGNTYVTGDGGPWPGGFDSSRLQLVTVKYDPSGNELWSAAVDTLTTTNYGFGLAPDAQGGVFVLGYEFSLLIHYLDALTTQLPEQPSDLLVHLFPNPASASLEADLGEWDGLLHVELYDGIGRSIRSEVVNAPGRLRLDVADLPTGNYLLRIRDQAGRQGTAMWNKL